MRAHRNGLYRPRRPGLISGLEMNRSYVTDGRTRLITKCFSDCTPRSRNNEAFWLGLVMDGWFSCHPFIVIGLQRFLNMVFVLVCWSFTFHTLRCSHAFSAHLVFVLAVIAALSFEIPMMARWSAFVLKKQGTILAYSNTEQFNELAPWRDDIVIGSKPTTLNRWGAQCS